MRLREFAPAGGGGSGNYFQALASAWYNGTFDSGSLQKGIKSQQDVERLLNRGIVCPDGKTRKLHIDYNSNFDGVEIYSDDYYEYGDHDDTIDSRTGQKWGPYDFMAFSDDELDEGLNEFAADDGDSGEDDALRNYARMWWAGDEATQMQIERALAKMGWEIGEDEGGYDNGGVFVVRAGDENGNSYQSWAAEDLTEGWKKGAAIGGTLGAMAGGVPGAMVGAGIGAGLQHGWTKKDQELKQQDTSSVNPGADAFSKEILNRLNKLKENAKTELSNLEDIPRHQLTIKLEKRITELEKILNIEMSAKGLQYLFNTMAESAPNLQSKWAIWKMMGADLSPEALRFLSNLDAWQLFADIYRGNWQNNKEQGMAEGDLNEKSTSQAQFRTMAAAAHNPEFARKVGIKPSVAREFNRADKKSNYKALPKKS